jgi:hypothetical protein
MATTWLLLEISIVFFYKNLYEFKTQRRSVVDEIERTPISIIDSNQNYNAICSNSTLTNQELIRINNDTSSTDFNQIETNNDDREMLLNLLTHTTNSSSNSQNGPFMIRLYNEYIRDDMVAMLTTSFTVFFMLTCLEVTLRAKKILF